MFIAQRVQLQNTNDIYNVDVLLMVRGHFKRLDILHLRGLIQEADKHHPLLKKG